MARKNLLIVDDNAVAKDALCQLLADAGYHTDGAGTAEAALDLFNQRAFEVVITDLQLPGMDGLELLRNLKQRNPETEVIVVTAFATIETAVQAIKLGAFDFSTKPVNPLELEHKVQAALERRKLRAELERLHNQNDYLRQEAEDSNRRMIGRSQAMKQVQSYVQLVASSDSTVLLRGESGTGKELIARAIHESSPRADLPFIRVNSAALPDGVLESELFGHERGAFTGAVKRKLGKFELAEDGTLFLDEIGDISPSAQSKLLRCLQEREFERVGGHETIQVACRIVAATNQNLEDLIDKGQFRQDLFYRLNVVPILLPPLRKRKEDIPELVDEFTRHYNQRFRKQVPSLSPEGLRRLLDYDWPGNIRELENIVERGVVLGSLELEAEKLTGTTRHRPLGGMEFNPGGEVGLSEYLERIERTILAEVYQRADQNKSRAANMLGIDRNLLRYKLNKYGLDAKRR